MITASLVACGGLIASCSSPAAKAASTTTTQSPQSQATAALQALLAPFSSIPGAHAPNPPQFAEGQAHQSWNIDKSAASAFTAAAALLPHWPRTGMGTPVAELARQPSETVQTTSAGTLAAESVSITVIPRSATTSTLQASVDVEYRTPKLAAEHVPDSSVLTATLQPVTRGVPGHATTKVITSHAVIAQVAEEINALPLAPLVAAYCPMIMPTTELVLTFPTTVVEISTHPTAICNTGAQMTVNGVHEPDLDDSMRPNLFTQLEQQTGITH